MRDCDSSHVKPQIPHLAAVESPLLFGAVPRPQGGSCFVCRRPRARTALNTRYSSRNGCVSFYFSHTKQFPAQLLRLMYREDFRSTRISSSRPFIVLRFVMKECRFHGVTHRFSKLKRVLYSGYPHRAYLDRPDRVLRPLLPSILAKHPRNERAEL